MHTRYPMVLHGTFDVSNDAVESLISVPRIALALADLFSDPVLAEREQEQQREIGE